MVQHYQSNMLLPGMHHTTIRQQRFIPNIWFAFPISNSCLTSLTINLPSTLAAGTFIFSLPQILLYCFSDIWRYTYKCLQTLTISRRKCKIILWEFLVFNVFCSSVLKNMIWTEKQEIIFNVFCSTYLICFFSI